jgi:Tol biopolymer transport system component
VIAAGGGEPRRLVSDDSFDYHPTWSPDGRWIAYAAFDHPPRYSIRILPAEGGEPRELLAEASLMMRPVWSADGRTLFFSRTSAGATNIWKIALSGQLTPRGPAERVTLGEGNDLYLTGPDASGRLAFATIKHRSDIWELTVETGALRQVTTETVVEDAAELSADGKTLVLESLRDGAPGIWTADLGGKLLTRIGGGYFPHWSPDGTQVSYTQSDPLAVMLKRPGDVAARLIASDASLSSWAPDGRHLLVERRIGDEISIVSVNIDNGREQVILEGFVSNLSAALEVQMTPDGTLIYHAMDGASVRQIWIRAAGSTEPRQLTSGADECSHPRRRPGSSDQIVYLENHKNILLRSLSTGETRRIAEFPEANLTIDYPSWSPDGTKIYFTMSKNVGDIFLLDNY